MKTDGLLQYFKRHLTDSDRRLKKLKEAHKECPQYVKGLLDDELNINKNLIKHASRVERLVKLGVQDIEKTDDKDLPPIIVEEPKVEETEPEKPEEKKEVRSEDIKDFESLADYEKYLREVLKVNPQTGETIDKDSPHAPAINLTGYTDEKGTHPGLIGRFGENKILWPLILKYEGLITNIASLVSHPDYSEVFLGDPFERAKEMKSILMERMYEFLKTKYNPKLGPVSFILSKRTLWQEFKNIINKEKKETGSVVETHKEDVCPSCKRPDSGSGDVIVLSKDEIEAMLENPKGVIWPPFLGSSEPEAVREQWYKNLEIAGQTQMIQCPKCEVFYRDGDQVDKRIAVTTTSTVSMDSQIAGEEEDERQLSEAIEDVKVEKPGEMTQEERRETSQTFFSLLVSGITDVFNSKLRGCEYDLKERERIRLTQDLSRLEKYTKQTEFEKVLNSVKKINPDAIREFMSELASVVADKIKAIEVDNKDEVEKITKEGNHYIDVEAKYLESTFNLTPDETTKIKLAAQKFLEDLESFETFGSKPGKCEKEQYEYYHYPCNKYNAVNQNGEKCPAFSTVKSEEDPNFILRYKYTTEAFFQVLNERIDTHEKKKTVKPINYEEIKERANSLIQDANKKIEEINKQLIQKGLPTHPPIPGWASSMGIINSLKKTIIPLLKQIPIRHSGIKGKTYGDFLEAFLEKEKEEKEGSTWQRLITKFSQHRLRSKLWKMLAR